MSENKKAFEGCLRTSKVDPDDETYWRSTEAFHHKAIQILEGIFSERILPEPEFKHGHQVFEPSEAPLYIAERPSYNSSKRKLAPFYYERRLDELFWDKRAPEFVLVVGEPGCGKTTLIDYYLRSYCPFQPAGEMEREEEEERMKDFQRKLVISADLRNVLSEEVLHKTFYGAAKRAITAAFDQAGKDVESVGCYDMWDREFKWDDPQNETDRKAQGVELSTYRHRRVGGKKLSDEEWVECAFDFLSRHMAFESEEQNWEVCPFRYLVVVLDNLDQSDLNVQIEAIRLLDSFYNGKPRLNLWQVYVPLWPESFDRLINAMRPFPDNRAVLRLRPPSADKLISTRTTDVMARKGKQLPDESEEKQWKLANQYVTSAMNDAREFFLEGILGKIGAYSCRLSLNLWKSTLSSRALYTRYREGRVRGDIAGFGVLGNYLLINAMLTGSGEFLHRDAAINPIANLFDLVEEHEGPRDLLIGLHMIHLLLQKKKQKIPYGSLEDTMVILGYERGKIFEAFEKLRDHGALRAVPSNSDGDYKNVFVPRITLVGYENLIKSNAYIDNVAMITPLDSEYLEEIDRVSDVIPETFIDRVQNSIAFLRQLQADEDMFRYSEFASNLNSSIDKERFVSRVNRMRLPSFAKLISFHYKENLAQFRKYHPFPEELVKASDWDRLVESDVFERVQAMEDYLVAKIGS